MPVCYKLFTLLWHMDGDLKRARETERVAGIGRRISSEQAVNGRC